MRGRTACLLRAEQVCLLSEVKLAARTAGCCLHANAAPVVGLCAQVLRPWGALVSRPGVIDDLADMSHISGLVHILTLAMRVAQVVDPPDRHFLWGFRRAFGGVFAEVATNLHSSITADGGVDDAAAKSLENGADLLVMWAVVCDEVVSSVATIPNFAGCARPCLQDVQQVLKIALDAAKVLLVDLSGELETCPPTIRACLEDAQLRLVQCAMRQGPPHPTFSTLLVQT